MNKVNVYEFNDMLKQVNTFMTDLPRRIQQVKMEINYCQEELQDLQHYIEFTNLSASQGYKIAKEIKEVHLKRRKLKDELEYLEMIDKRMKNVLRHHDGINQVADGINRTTEKISTRTYTPRVRKDLFE